MIIITRPSPYGEELVQLCYQANLPALHFPLFRIIKGCDFDNLQTQLDALTEGDIIISVSPQVSHMIAQQNNTIHFPDQVYYYAIGRQSAKLFEQICQRPVNFPPQNENSEGLIEYLTNQSHPLNQHQVLILGGDVRRTLIDTTLKSQGAFVKDNQIYQRELIKYHPTVLDEYAHNIIVVTSIEHLLQLQTYCHDKNKKQDKLIITAERIFQVAKKLGWQQIYSIQHANNQNLFKTIASLCHNADVIKQIT